MISQIMSEWSDRTSFTEALELALVEQKRAAVLRAHIHNFSDENRVITCINGGGQFTIQLDETSRKYRRSALSRMECNAKRMRGRGILFRPSEEPGERCLIFRKNVDGEILALTNVPVGKSAAINAHQNFKRLE